MTCDQVRNLMQIRKVPSACTTGEIASIIAHNLNCQECKEWTTNFDKSEGLKDNPVFLVDLIFKAMTDPECAKILLDALRKQKTSALKGHNEDC